MIVLFEKIVQQKSVHKIPIFVKTSALEIAQLQIASYEMQRIHYSKPNPATKSGLVEIDNHKRHAICFQFIKTVPKFAFEKCRARHT